MVSLYVCDIPGHIEKKEVDQLFSEFQGFVDCRLVKDKNRDKIAFVDFDKESQAKFVIEHLNGYRFSGSHKGISIRISEHSRGNVKKREPSSNNGPPARKSDRYSSDSEKRSYKDEEVKRGFQPPDTFPSLPREPSYPPPAPEIPTPQDPSREISIKDFLNAAGMVNLLKLLGENKTAAPSAASLYPPSTQVIAPDINTYNPIIAQNALTQRPVQTPQFPQEIRPMSPPIPPPVYPMGPSPSLLSAPRPPGFSTAQPSISPLGSPPNNFNSYVLTNLSRYYNSFQNLINIPSNAANTVYVEGIPFDASEREVAHIFRPFPGYKSVRLIPRDTKTGERVVFCFADFETMLQATLVINTLQGYRFDKDDILGLQLSYAMGGNKPKH